MFLSFENSNEVHLFYESPSLILTGVYEHRLLDLVYTTENPPNLRPNVINVCIAVPVIPILQSRFTLFDLIMFKLFICGVQASQLSVPHPGKPGVVEVLLWSTSNHCGVH